MNHQRIIDSPHAIKLDELDPNDTGGLHKDDATDRTPPLEAQLARLQEVLYGANQHAVLIILQGMDTAGKDGTVKHVMGVVNPMGCQAWSFKQPTQEELSHDFLWRVHKLAPPRGVLGIFNRSQYEDVLVARVHGLVPTKVWEDRYEQINHFEQMLAKNNTIILKFFLHISKDEQEQRLLAREKDPDKSWKLSVGDWEERAYWDAYQEAYQDAIGKCGTAHAPWFIIPSNKKWYRNYLIAQTIVDYLSPHSQQWEDDLQEQGKRALAAIRTAHVHDEVPKEKAKK